MLVRARRVDGGEILQCEIQHRLGTGNPHGSCGNIEAVKTQLRRMSKLAVITAHPFHKVTVGLEPADTLSETGILDRVIVALPATADVFVHFTRPRKAALNGDGGKAVRSHQALEECVSELQDLLASVQGLSKAE